MARSQLSRKSGNQKRQNILYAKHQEHHWAVLFLSVTEEASFVVSQIQSLSPHRLDPHPVKRTDFVNRRWIKPQSLPT